MISQYTFYHWSITTYTGLSLVICILWCHCLLGTISCLVRQMTKFDSWQLITIDFTTDFIDMWLKTYWQKTFSYNFKYYVNVIKICRIKFVFLSDLQYKVKVSKYFWMIKRNEKLEVLSLFCLNQLCVFCLKCRVTMRRKGIRLE